LKKIKASAPGKLMLFGEHAVVYGYPCIVTAVEQRVRVEVQKIENDILKIEAPEVGVRGYTKKIKSLGEKANIPKGVIFLNMAVKNFFKKYKIESGLKIKTKSEFSSEFGFGSSSAVTVAAIKALAELFKIKLKNKQLFDLAYKTVLEVQGVGSGFDLAAAIWGGTLLFVTGGRKIVPLKIKELPLVVGYTGVKADTPTLVRKVAELRQRYPQLVDGIFDNINFVVEEAKNSLIEGDWQKTGELMILNQGLLEALGVNTKKLSDLIFAALDAGAYGAKLSGAGGGDCMIALGSERMKREIAQAVEKAGGKYLEVKPNAEGVRIE